jgi:G:T-mismatch repair DNA endonuclease (very short patch repair protein)
VDGYDAETKTVYEFYGDFWHGNPSVYDPEQINPVRGITYGALFEETQKRETALKKAGYRIVSIWEKDWNEQIICT